MTDYDAIVIGGGPAGSTAATLVAQAGHRVLLAERSTEPQFKIGESLMPGTYWTLDRLGMLPRMRASHFPRKYSVQFFTPEGKGTRPFYFFENDPTQSSQTWQVLRSEFDEMLLENAAERGVEVRRGATVSEVLFEGERAVGVRLKGDPPRELSCRVVIDASGQNSVLGRRFGFKLVEPNLKHVAVFSHFHGALRDPGIDEGATLVLHTDNQQAWFWYIPLPDDVVSVGVVGPLEYLVSGRAPDPQRVFDEEVARCPALAPRLGPARQGFPIMVRRDFSYRCRRIAGDGWVLVGDAFGFIDPIYSTGVLFAFKSGEMAADAVVAGLADGDLSGARLGQFGPAFSEGMEALRRLVYAFYHPSFSFGRFLRIHPECRRGIITLLSGNVYREPYEGLFEAMSELIDLPDRPPFEVPELLGALPS